MLKKLIVSTAFFGALGLSAGAAADHNSRWGEGWANMPNDIHNTRVDTRGDSDAFRNFVRYGNGADSVNRYATSSSRTQRAKSDTAARSRAGGQPTHQGGRTRGR